MKNPTFKDLWNIAKKRKKDLLREQDYLPIIIASTVSASVSWILSKWDFINYQVTGNIFFDIIFVSILFSLIFFGIVLLSLLILRFVDRLVLFLSLVWKHWSFKK